MIESYAKMLGFEVNSIDYEEAKIINNANSGYFCALTEIVNSFLMQLL